MKKIFYYLLKKYSKTEKDRLEILEILHEQVRNEYTEQSGFGNVYNYNIEFLMSNSLIRKLIEENDFAGLEMIKIGLSGSTEKAFKYIKNEPRKLKLQRLKKINDSK